MEALQKLIDEARHSLFSVKGADAVAALEEVQAEFAELDARTTALEEAVKRIAPPTPSP